MKQYPNSKASISVRQTLLSLMKEKPYKEISVAEITRRAKISRQAFYLNYESKDDVLQHQFSVLLPMILSKVESQKITCIEDLIKTYTEIVKSLAGEFSVIVDNDLGSMLGDLLVQEFADIPPIIPNQKQGKSMLEHKYINSFWIYAFIQVYSLWIKDGMTTPDEEISQMLVNIMKGNYFT